MKLVHFILTENDETTDDGSFLRFYMVFDEENMIYVYRPSFNNWKYQSPSSHHLAHVQKYATYKDAEKAARKLQNECNREIAHISPEELDKELRDKRPPKFVVREANIEIAGQKGIKSEKVKKVSSKGQVIRLTTDDGRIMYIGGTGLKDNPYSIGLLNYLPGNLFAVTVSNPVRAIKFAKGVPPEVIKKIKDKMLGVDISAVGGVRVTKVEAIDMKDLIHIHGE